MKTNYRSWNSLLILRSKCSEFSPFLSFNILRCFYASIRPVVFSLLYHSLQIYTVADRSEMELFVPSAIQVTRYFDSKLFVHDDVKAELGLLLNKVWHTFISFIFMCIVPILHFFILNFAYQDSYIFLLCLFSMMPQLLSCRTQQYASSRTLMTLLKLQKRISLVTVPKFAIAWMSLV